MFTHLTANNQPNMVDITPKTKTKRIATACCKLLIPRQIANLLTDGEIIGKKGPVFATAIVAGTQAAKRTAELIPFCHQVPLESLKISIVLKDSTCIKIKAEAKTEAKTGVEMEALTACSVAALTVYDMLKSVSNEILVTDLKLIHKEGGKSSYA